MSPGLHVGVSEVPVKEARFFSRTACCNVSGEMLCPQPLPVRPGIQVRRPHSNTNTSQLQTT